MQRDFSIVLRKIIPDGKGNTDILGYLSSLFGKSCNHNENDMQDER